MVSRASRVFRCPVRVIMRARAVTLPILEVSVGIFGNTDIFVGILINSVEFLLCQI